MGREGAWTAWPGKLPARARVLSRAELEAALPTWAGVFAPGDGPGSEGAAAQLSGPRLHPMRPIFAAAGADAGVLAELDAAYNEASGARHGK